MTGLLLLGIAIAIYALVQLAKPDPPLSQRSFPAQLQNGELTATVSFQASVDAESKIQRAINRWAIRLENPKHPLDNQLEDYLLLELPAISTSVIEITLKSPPPPPDEPPPQTEAERLDADILGKVDCAETLMNRLAWLQKEKPDIAKSFLKGGRSLAREVEDLKDEEFQGLEDALKHRVNSLFHDPNRVR